MPKKSFFPGSKPGNTGQNGTPPGGAATSEVASQKTQPEGETVAEAIERQLSTDQRISSQDIPLSRLRPNPFQGREEFTEEDIEEMAESIRQHGFFTTLLVRPDPTEDGYFQLAYGERRWRAAQRVQGLNAIPCRISEYTDERMEDMGLLENLQRKQLNPLEEARSLQKRMQRTDPQTGKSYSIRSLAEHLGVARHRIEIPLRLIDLPPDVEEMVRQRSDTVRIAYELKKLPIPEMRKPIEDMVLEGKVGTRDVIYMVEQQLATLAAREQEQTSAKEGEEHSLAGSQRVTQQEEKVSETGQPIVVQHLEEPLSARADTSPSLSNQPQEKTPALVLSLGAASWQRQAKIQRDISAVEAVIKRWSEWSKTDRDIIMSMRVEKWIKDLQALNETLQPRSDEKGTTEQ